MYCTYMYKYKYTSTYCHAQYSATVNTQMSAFSFMGLLLYKSIISGALYMGVVLRWICRKEENSAGSQQLRGHEHVHV